jgi:hypothetical protein
MSAPFGARSALNVSASQDPAVTCDPSAASVSDFSPAPDVPASMRMASAKVALEQ